MDTVNLIYYMNLWKSIFTIDKVGNAARHFVRVYRNANIHTYII